MSPQNNTPNGCGSLPPFPTFPINSSSNNNRAATAPGGAPIPPFSSFDEFLAGSQPRSVGQISRSSSRASLIEILDAALAIAAEDEEFFSGLDQFRNDEDGQDQQE